MGRGPFLVETKAHRHESELIIGRGCDEHGRSIGWNGGILERFSARIDWGDEGGPAFRPVVEGDVAGDRTAGGESDDADTIRGNTPFRGVLPNVGDCCSSVGEREWNDAANNLPKFIMFGYRRCKFLGSVFAGVREAVLQDKGCHPSRGHVLGDISALAAD